MIPISAVQIGFPLFLFLVPYNKYWSPAPIYDDGCIVNDKIVVINLPI
jgi:hypothetical protein